MEGPFASAVNSNKNLEIGDKLATWYGLTLRVGSTPLTSQMPHLEDAVIRDKFRPDIFFSTNELMRETGEHIRGVNANLNSFDGVIDFRMGAMNEDARTTLSHEDEPDCNAE